MQAAVSRAVELYGRLDVAFNNGAMITPPGPLDQVPEADFDRLYAVNLRGPWLAMVAELPAYGAMKRAVNSLTESAAITYGPEGIRVNAIAPGHTATEMIRSWEADSPGLVERLKAHTPATPRGRSRRNRRGRRLAAQ